jgi:hypothetical protein
MLTGTLRSSLLISPSHVSMFYIVVLLRLEVVVPRNRRQLVTCPEVAPVVIEDERTLLMSYVYPFVARRTP